MLYMYDTVCFVYLIDIYGLLWKKVMKKLPILLCNTFVYTYKVYKNGKKW